MPAVAESGLAGVVGRERLGFPCFWETRSKLFSPVELNLHSQLRSTPSLRQKMSCGSLLPQLATAHAYAAKQTQQRHPSLDIPSLAFFRFPVLAAGGSCCSQKLDSRIFIYPMSSLNSDNRRQPVSRWCAKIGRIECACATGVISCRLTHFQARQRTPNTPRGLPRDRCAWCLPFSIVW